MRLSRGLLAACLWRSEAGRQAQALLRVGAICCLPVCGWPGRLCVAQGGQGARADPAACLFVAGLAGPPVRHWLSKLGWLMMPGCLEGHGRANSADGLLWQHSVLPEQAVRVPLCWWCLTCITGRQYLAACRQASQAQKCFQSA